MLHNAPSPSSGTFIFQSSAARWGGAAAVWFLFLPSGEETPEDPDVTEGKPTFLQQQQRRRERAQTHGFMELRRDDNVTPDQTERLPEDDSSSHRCVYRAQLELQTQVTCSSGEQKPSGLKHQITFSKSKP